MGQCKAELPFGETTIIEKIISELSFFDEIFISANDRKFGKYGKIVCDIYKNKGPMGGIHSALCSCISEALFAIACDMPLISENSVRKLCDLFDASCDGAVIIHNNRIEPLFAIYKKEIAKYFEKCILKGEYSIQKAVRGMNIQYVPSEYLINSSMELQNINTPGDYEELKTYENQFRRSRQANERQYNTVGYGIDSYMGYTGKDNRR
ncbi:putative molybdenum cofactor guanylyltransferase [Clostridiales bacterium]|nr:putative molybdenum cofactor guanylyltransferase [Clostridiales bacterium]